MGKAFQATRGFLAFLYFSTQVAWGHAVEARFWEERQAASRRVQESQGGSSRARSAPKDDWLAGLPSPRLSSALVTAGAADLPSAHSSGPLLPQNLQKIFLPFLTVQQLRLSSDPSAPLILHIQDAHGVAEAQRNMAAALDALAAVRQEPLLVGMEGAEGRFLTEPLRDLADAAATRRVMGHYLKAGLLSGPEFAAVVSARPPLLAGVEDMALYRQNVSALKRSRAAREGLASRLRAWTATADGLRDAVHSPAFLDFDRRVRAYRRGGAPLSEYARALSALAPEASRGGFPNFRLLLRALAREESLDFAEVERQRRRLAGLLSERLPPSVLESLVRESLAYREGRLRAGEYHRLLTGLCARAGLSLGDFGPLAAYVDYVASAEAVVPGSLSREINRIESLVAGRLTATLEQRRLAAASRRLALLEKLIDLRMTPSDWESYRRERDAILGLPEELISLARAGDPSFAAPEGWSRADLEPFEGFCRTAEERNASLVDNLLETLHDRKPPTLSPQPSALTSASQVAVLVAGGFHTPGLTEKLKGAGVSFAVLTPRLTDFPKTNDYLDVFLRRPPPLEQALSGEVLFAVLTGRLAERRPAEVPPADVDRAEMVAALAVAGAEDTPAFRGRVEAAALALGLSLRVLSVRVAAGVRRLTLLFRGSAGMDAAVEVSETALPDGRFRQDRRALPWYHPAALGDRVEGILEEVEETLHELAAVLLLVPYERAGNEVRLKLNARSLRVLLVKYAAPAAWFFGGLTLRWFFLGHADGVDLREAAVRLLIGPPSLYMFGRHLLRMLGSDRALYDLYPFPVDAVARSPLSRSRVLMDRAGREGGAGGGFRLAHPNLLKLEDASLYRPYLIKRFKEGLTYEEARLWRQARVEKGLIVPTFGVGYWGSKTTALNDVLATMGPRFYDAWVRKDVKKMKKIFLEEVAGYKAVGAKYKKMNPAKAFFLEKGGLAGMMGKPRSYLSKTNDPVSVVELISKPLARSLTIFEMGRSREKWNPEYAKERILQALYSIDGFWDAHDKMNIARMAQLYRDKVKKHEGGQLGFFKAKGLSGLIAGSKTFLGNRQDSPAAWLQFAIPEIFTAPDGLEIWEVEQRYFEDPENGARHILRALKKADGFAAVWKKGDPAEIGAWFAGLSPTPRQFFKQFPDIMALMSFQRGYMASLAMEEMLYFLLERRLDIRTTGASVRMRMAFLEGVHRTRTARRAAAREDRNATMGDLKDSEADDVIQRYGDLMTEDAGRSGRIRELLAGALESLPWEEMLERWPPGAAELSADKVKSGIRALMNDVTLKFVPTPEGVLVRKGKIAAGHYGSGGEAHGYAGQFVYLAQGPENALFLEQEQAVVTAHELAHFLFKRLDLGFPHNSDEVHEFASAVHRAVSARLLGEASAMDDRLDRLRETVLGPDSLRRASRAASEAVARLEEAVSAAVRDGKDLGQAAAELDERFTAPILEDLRTAEDFGVSPPRGFLWSRVLASGPMLRKPALQELERLNAPFDPFAHSLPYEGPLWQGRGMADDPGERYELDVSGPLGDSGVGIFYRAWDRRARRWVAIKFGMLDALRQTGQEVFWRDYEIRRELQDRVPGVLPGWDGGDWPGRGPFVVMELAGGEDLFSRISQGRAPPGPDGLLRFTLALITQLAAIHKAGWLYNDYKPHNILFASDEDWEPLLTDFEFAIRESEGETFGRYAGTAAYSAPELFGEKKFGQGTDLYALGTVLYELFTGTLPFEDIDPADASDPFIVGPIKSAGLPVPIHEAAANSGRPEIPPALADFIMKLIAQKPEDRFSSSEEALKALQSIMSGEKAAVPLAAGIDRFDLLKLTDGKPFKFGEFSDPREVAKAEWPELSIPTSRDPVRLRLAGEFPEGYKTDGEWGALLREALEREGFSPEVLAGRTLTVVLADEDTHYAGNCTNDGIVVLHKRIFQDATPLAARALVLASLAHELGGHEIPGLDDEAAHTAERRAKDFANFRHFAGAARADLTDVLHRNVEDGEALAVEVSFGDMVSLEIAFSETDDALEILEQRLRAGAENPQPVSPRVTAVTQRQYQDLLDLGFKTDQDRTSLLHQGLMALIRENIVSVKFHKDTPRKFRISFADREIPMEMDPDNTKSIAFNSLFGNTPIRDDALTALSDYLRQNRVRPADDLPVSVGFELRTREGADILADALDPTGHGRERLVSREDSAALSRVREAFRLRDERAAMRLEAARREAAAEERKSGRAERSVLPAKAPEAPEVPEAPPSTRAVSRPAFVRAVLWGVAVAALGLAGYWVSLALETGGRTNTPEMWALGASAFLLGAWLATFFAAGKFAPARLLGRWPSARALLLGALALGLYRLAAPLVSGAWGPSGSVLYVDGLHEGNRRQILDWLRERRMEAGERWAAPLVVLPKEESVVRAEASAERSRLLADLGREGLAADEVHLAGVLAALDRDSISARGGMFKSFDGTDFFLYQGQVRNMRWLAQRRLEAKAEAFRSAARKAIQDGSDVLLVLPAELRGAFRKGRPGTAAIAEPGEEGVDLPSADPASYAAWRAWRGDPLPRKEEDRLLTLQYPWEVLREAAARRGHPDVGAALNTALRPLLDSPNFMRELEGLSFDTGLVARRGRPALLPQRIPQPPVPGLGDTGGGVFSPGRSRLWQGGEDPLVPLTRRPGSPGVPRGIPSPFPEPEQEPSRLDPEERTFLVLSFVLRQEKELKRKLLSDQIRGLFGLPAYKPAVPKPLNILQARHSRYAEQLRKLETLRASSGWTPENEREYRRLRRSFWLTHSMTLAPLWETFIPAVPRLIADYVFDFSPILDPTGWWPLILGALAIFGVVFALVHPDVRERGIGRQERTIRFFSRFVGGIVLAWPFLFSSFGFAFLHSYGRHLAWNGLSELGVPGFRPLAIRSLRPEVWTEERLGEFESAVRTYSHEFGNRVYFLTNFDYQGKRFPSLIGLEGWTETLSAIQDYSLEIRKWQVAIGEFRSRPEGTDLRRSLIHVRRILSYARESEEKFKVAWVNAKRLVDSAEDIPGPEREDILYQLKEAELQGRGLHAFNEDPLHFDTVGRPEVVDVGATCREMLSHWPAPAPVWEGSAEPMRCKIDPYLLEVILYNLVQNAQEASEFEDGPRVVVRMRRGRVELEVSDQGPGIPAAMMDRLARQDVTTKGEGHGSGLALVRRIVADAGGFIQVASKESGSSDTRRVRWGSDPARARGDTVAPDIETPSGTRFVVSFPESGRSPDLGIPMREVLSSFEANRVRVRLGPDREPGAGPASGRDGNILTEIRVALEDADLALFRANEEGLAELAARRAAAMYGTSILLLTDEELQALGLGPGPGGFRWNSKGESLGGYVARLLETMRAFYQVKDQAGRSRSAGESVDLRLGETVVRFTVSPGEDVSLRWEGEEWRMPFSVFLWRLAAGGSWTLELGSGMPGQENFIRIPGATVLHAVIVFDRRGEELVVSLEPLSLSKDTSVGDDAPLLEARDLFRFRLGGLSQALSVAGGLSVPAAGARSLVPSLRPVTHVVTRPPDAPPDDQSGLKYKRDTEPEGEPAGRGKPPENLSAYGQEFLEYFWAPLLGLLIKENVAVLLAVLQAGARTDNERVRALSRSALSLMGKDEKVRGASRRRLQNRVRNLAYLFSPAAMGADLTERILTGLDLLLSEERGPEIGEIREGFRAAGLEVRFVAIDRLFSSRRHPNRFSRGVFEILKRDKAPGFPDSLTVYFNRNAPEMRMLERAANSARWAGDGAAVLRAELLARAAAKGFAESAGISPRTADGIGLAPAGRTVLRREGSLAQYAGNLLFIARNAGQLNRQTMRVPRHPSERGRQSRRSREVLVEIVTPSAPEVSSPGGATGGARLAIPPPPMEGESVSPAVTLRAVRPKAPKGRSHRRNPLATSAPSLAATWALGGLFFFLPADPGRSLPEKAVKAVSWWLEALAAVVVYSILRGEGHPLAAAVLGSAFVFALLHLAGHVIRTENGELAFEWFWESPTPLRDFGGYLVKGLIFHFAPLMVWPAAPVWVLFLWGVASHGVFLWKKTSAGTSAFPAAFETVEAVVRPMPELEEVLLQGEARPLSMSVRLGRPVAVRGQWADAARRELAALGDAAIPAAGARPFDPAAASDQELYRAAQRLMSDAGLRTEAAGSFWRAVERVEVDPSLYQNSILPLAGFFRAAGVAIPRPSGAPASLERDAEMLAHLGGTLIGGGLSAETAAARLSELWRAFQDGVIRRVLVLGSLRAALFAARGTPGRARTFDVSDLLNPDVPQARRDEMAHALAREARASETGSSPLVLISGEEDATEEGLIGTLAARYPALSALRGRVVARTVRSRPALGTAEGKISLKALLASVRDLGFSSLDVFTLSDRRLDQTGAEGWLRVLVLLGGDVLRDVTGGILQKLEGALLSDAHA